MPTYEYVCTDCGSDLEAVQSFSEPSLIECPTCSGKLRKRFGAVGVVFKGSGFYRNDSRTESRDGASQRKGDSADKPDGKGDSAGSADKPTKAAPKAEPSAAKGSGDRASAKSNSDSSNSGSRSSNGAGSGRSNPKASSAA